LICHLHGLAISELGAIVSWWLNRIAFYTVGVKKAEEGLGSFLDCESANYHAK